MIALLESAASIAETDCPVLILGESGTGKRTVAHHIHQLSRRNAEPFRTFEDRSASSLGGNKSGKRIPQAGGTIYLPLSAGASRSAEQATANFTGRGATSPRIMLGGTIEDLQRTIRETQIRHEFCYASVCLLVPPLRVRREDLLPLCEHFLREFARIFNRPRPKLNKEMVAFFHDYRWPGNVAELATAIKSLVVLGDERVVLAALRASSWSHPRNGNSPPASLKEASRAASLDAERELIADVLSATGWNRKKTALQLQISYKALLYKLKHVGLDSVVHHRSVESKDL